MVPVTRPLVMYVMNGADRSEEYPDLRPNMAHLGQVLAFDPETHSFACAGMSMEQFRLNDFVVLRESHRFYPKWENFKAGSKRDLEKSWQTHSRAASEVEARLTESEVRLIETVAQL